MHYTLLAIGILITFYAQCMEEQRPLSAEFLAIQKIHFIAQQVADKTRTEYKNMDVQVGKKKWPGTNPFYQQTKQGLYLTITDYPNSLGTPYGLITLYGVLPYFDNGNVKLTQEFMRYFTLTPLSFCNNSERWFSSDKYEIIAIEGVPVPKLILHEKRSDYKSYEAANAEYADLEKQYHSTTNKV